MGLPKGINKARIANMRKSQKERERRKRTNRLAMNTIRTLEKVNDLKSKK